MSDTEDISGLSVVLPQLANGAATIGGGGDEIQWTWSHPRRSTTVDGQFDGGGVYTDQDASGYAGGSAVQTATLGGLQCGVIAEPLDDELEPGEVIVSDLGETPVVAQSSLAQPNQTSSAHNMYNSYGFNPWSQFLQTQQSGSSCVSASTSGGSAGAPSASIFNKENILKSELQHLRGSLSEKTCEVQRLTRELEKAYGMINRLREHGDQRDEQRQQLPTNGKPSAVADVLSQTHNDQSIQEPLNDQVSRDNEQNRLPSEHIRLKQQHAPKNINDIGERQKPSERLSLSNQDVSDVFSEQSATVGTGVENCPPTDGLNQSS